MFKFQLFMVFAFVTVASAGHYGGHQGGHSVSSRKQDWISAENAEGNAYDWWVVRTSFGSSYNQCTSIALPDSVGHQRTNTYVPPGTCEKKWKQRALKDHGNFAFNYGIVDGHGATNGRSETGNGYGGVVGSYYLKDVDGRSRIVDYVADKGGFRAKIKTNEPGTAHSLAADAVYNSPYHGPIVHGAIVHGPMVHGGHGPKGVGYHG